MYKMVAALLALELFLSRPQFTVLWDHTGRMQSSSRSAVLRVGTSSVTDAGHTVTHCPEKV